jgi:hypothetical protein
MARPAASSFAEFILNPVERRVIAVSISRSFLFIASAAIFAAVLVFITLMTLTSCYGFKKSVIG